MAHTDPHTFRLRSAHLPLTFFKFSAKLQYETMNFKKHDQPCNNGFIEIIIWKHAFEQKNSCNVTGNEQPMLTFNHKHKHCSKHAHRKCSLEACEKHGQPCNNGIIQINIWKHALEKKTHATSHAMKQYSITMQLLKHTIAFFFSTLIPLLLTHLRSQAHCPSQQLVPCAAPASLVGSAFPILSISATQMAGNSRTSG